MDRAVEPTLAALRAKGIDYRGVLYAGLMLTEAGPRVLEYNVRFGDPEAQVVLPRLASSLTDLLAAAAAGDLSGVDPAFGPEAAACVVAASEGYPEAPTRQGSPIDGVGAANQLPGVTVFCAGVDTDASARLVTAGGRVLAVSALGPDLEVARDRAYEGMSHITFPGMQYRKDIAQSVTELPR
jgi:phosphoribosylamine--glycine ligase